MLLWIPAVLGLAAPWPSRGEGSVFLVVGADTAIWNVPGGLDVTRFRARYLPDLYTLPQENAYRAMDPAFRNRFLDSTGQPLKLTWWMLVGSMYGQAENTDIPVPNLMPLDLMKKYHGQAIQQLGDELSLHYHTFFWSDYDGDGVFYWNQARTFHECRADFDLALAETLLEEEVFPVSFRSGWHYMDNEWQARLNTLLPFSLHNASPGVHTDTIEPLENVYDWSKAPTVFVPFQPSVTNYQIPGEGPGWNVRSVKIPSVTQSMMNHMFAQAAGGTNQVACFWAHLPEAEFLGDLARIDQLAHAAATNFPSVPFHYCTAIEAMQRWLGTLDHSPPVITVTESIKSESVTLSIATSKPLFQPQPFVALKDIWGQYRVLTCVADGSNTWHVDLPVPGNRLAKVGVAATDPFGNLATRLIRYLPDDFYLDNSDPQYSELTGNWVRNTNAAWGLDSRTALLGENDTAQARWSLPVLRSGRHKLFVQVPAVSNAASRVHFTVWSGSSNAATAFSATPLPPLQWVSLGTPFLDQANSNWLVMTVSGQGQPGTVAVADVVRLSALVPDPAFINDLQIDPGDTTANLLWTTPNPATSRVQYGLDLGYGAFSTTNPFPVTNHLVTLTGLTPDTTYYFQVESVAGDGLETAQGFFTTTDRLATKQRIALLSLTNTWKYCTSNLDGVQWQEPAFDDSLWPSGPALLWVDTNATPNSGIPAANTAMPLNPATGWPYHTYYFRTRFTFSENPFGATLSFSNYIDDGAVFYLNGVEVRRNNMPAAPTVISNATLATAYNCTGNATCPVRFTVTGPAITNLVRGENLLAVEVHNYDARSPDITFGSALTATFWLPHPPQIKLFQSGNAFLLYWNGEGFTLQQTDQLGPPASWTDVPGPAAISPFVLTNPAPGFYRLHY